MQYIVILSFVFKELKDSLFDEDDDVVETCVDIICIKSDMLCRFI